MLIKLIHSSLSLFQEILYDAQVFISAEILPENAITHFMVYNSSYKKQATKIHLFSLAKPFRIHVLNGKVLSYLTLILLIRKAHPWKVPRSKHWRISSGVKLVMEQCCCEQVNHIYAYEKLLVICA